MARLARIAVPEIPYHVTQRGNRRQPVFFCEDDYHLYLALLKQHGDRFGLRVWAYCLMTNHVHLIVVPAAEHSLAHGLGEVHRRYTRQINFREGWRGYLWQGRFASYPLDETHLIAAIRYVERNPVAACLVERAEDYPWSSAQAHVRGTPDALLSPHPLTDQISDWATFLTGPEDAALPARLERHGRTGRPLGTTAFIRHLEQQLGRPVHPRKPGPKTKSSV